MESSWEKFDVVRNQGPNSIPNLSLHGPCIVHRLLDCKGRVSQGKKGCYYWLQFSKIGVFVKEDLKGLQGREGKGPG